MAIGKREILSDYWLGHRDGLAEAGAEIKRLRKIFAWIDNIDPELIAQAEEKFCLNLV